MTAKYTSWLGQLGLELAGLFCPTLIERPPYNAGQLGSYLYIWCKATWYTALAPMFRGRGKKIKDILRCWYVLVEEWFYSANIGGIIDDSFLKANRSIVIYLCNEEVTHEF